MRGRALAWLAVLALIAAAADATPRTAPKAHPPKPQKAAPAEHFNDDQLAGKASGSALEPSTDAWHVINWVIASHDNNGLPFMIIDKVAAAAFVYDGSGQMVAGAPVLVGIKAGDHANPDVGDRELSNIPPDDRTTPAGRFVAKFGLAAGGREVLWVDYRTAISLHAVITTNKAEHRLQRLNSSTPDDNRITFGCINVPTEFYAKVVKPLFKGSGGIVYILPETQPLNAVFLALPGPPSPPTLLQP